MRYARGMAATIVIVVSDLMFQSRIEAAARALGHATVIGDTAERAADALAASPALVVLDLHERAVEPAAIIRDAKAAGARVLAFGRHTEPQTLRAAREAGADTVVPRSQLVEELGALIASLVDANAVSDDW